MTILCPLAQVIKCDIINCNGHVVGGLGIDVVNKNIGLGFSIKRCICTRVVAPGFQILSVAFLKINPCFDPDVCDM